MGRGIRRIMSYSIYFNKHVKKFVDGLDEAQKDRIKKKLRALGEDPFAGDVKKVKGREGVYRIRIGNLRVLYILEQKEHAIYVVNIDKRSKIY